MGTGRRQDLWAGACVNRELHPKQVCAVFHRPHHAAPPITYRRGPQALAQPLVGGRIKKALPYKDSAKDVDLMIRET